MLIRKSNAADAEPLFSIWLRSVRATHVFLGESDIQNLIPLVRSYLCTPNPDLWTLCAGAAEPIGFMGLSGNKVDALFIAPEHLRRGGGKLLLEHARKLRGPLRVDVNEQNPQALKFYEVNGFRVVGRSPLDGEGRPFPLLHMCEAGAEGHDLALERGV